MDLIFYAVPPLNRSNVNIEPITFLSTVYAKDGGLPPNFAKATVKITVLDENDNSPVFGRVYYSLEVPENQEPVALFTLRATDEDSGDSAEITYKITGDNYTHRKSHRQSFNPNKHFPSAISLFFLFTLP